MIRRRKKVPENFTVPDFDEFGLEQLARDCVDNKIFATWNINGAVLEHAKHIFFPIQKYPEHWPNLYRMWKQMPGKTDQKIFEPQDDIVHLFEYVSKATKNTWSGYPIFLTCKGLKRKYAWPLINHMVAYEREKRASVS